MHRYTPRREPETLRGYARREEYEGEMGPRGRGKIVNLPMSLKFDGKSNWKAFYAKFSHNSLKALVAKDKTRSAQSSRSPSGVWRTLLNCAWTVSGSSLNSNRFSRREPETETPRGYERRE
jgi:hypothetical protein